MRLILAFINLKCFAIELQTIDNDFACFLREKRIQYVNCCTDDGNTWGLNLLMKTGVNLKVKLGYDWSLMCEANKFVGGDVVRFKFDTNFRCHVFKSGRC
jgi:hypothetical protein